MKFLITLCCSVFFVFCINAQNEISPKLNNYLQGKWIKTSGDKDTLEFGKLNSKTTFLLTKQYGTKPPKNPEGPYSFIITTRGIQLHWLFSSSMSNNFSYFFKLDTLAKTMIIGNFYANPKDIKLLYFKKVINHTSLK